MKPVRSGDDVHAATYADRLFSREIPKYRLPEESMPADAAYRLVADELNLDGNPALNLASFVTTWMEPEADRLGTETANRNLIDQDEYPRTQVIHQRMVSMVASLFNAPPDATGTATEGSSEAIMLALLAHKWRWRERRRRDGEATDRPNLVIGADVHTCWEKFARYFDVEARVAPMEPGHYTLSAADVEARVDENTIAVGCILGTTFTGQIDDIVEINELLERLGTQRGLDIPIHVDAASGGFIARSPTPTFSGTSARAGCSPSTSPTTSSGSCIRAWARSCSGTRPICPTTWCSRSPTWAATAPTTA